MELTLKVFYSQKLVAVQGKQSFGGIQSPSSRKPAELAKVLESMDGIQFIEPKPLTIEDLKLCHDPNYIDGVISLSVENGFGTKDKAISDSLLYTNGAMYEATKSATSKSPTCALVSGFHHAGYNGWKNLGWFCTFNGLVISAVKMLPKKVAIIDCDMHWGNGTDDILKHKPELKKHIFHLSFGRYFTGPEHADDYLSWFKENGEVEKFLKQNTPDVILYQAGADVHIDDPYGGVLNTEQMKERDRRMFTIARDLDIPLAWNLAGGYQIEENGSIQKVIDLHVNTFNICREVYSF